MNRTALTLLAAALTALAAGAESWLPSHRNPMQRTRLLSCRYDGPSLKSISPATDDWNVSSEPDTVSGGTLYTFTAKKAMDDVGVAVALDVYNWNSDNYVMIPAVVYGGNRQRIVNRAYATGLAGSDYFWPDLALTSNPIPQLSPEFGRESRLEVNVSNTSTPVMTYYERGSKKGAYIFTDQGIERDGGIIDNALIVEEAPDRSVATFVVSAPGVRERKPEFIGFSKSPDRGVSVKPGDRISIRIDEVPAQADNVAEFLSGFFGERKRHLSTAPVRDLMPMSKMREYMLDHIDSRWLEGEKYSFYRPENADWMSYGWIGGLMNTYPMLATGDPARLDKVVRTFDYALANGYGASGYFYNTLDANGKVFDRDESWEVHGIGLVRKNADLLYWLIKQFNLLRAQGHADVIKPQWVERARCLADAFVNTWQKYGTWGNHIEVESGDVALFNTTGGAMAVAGLTLAAEYFHDKKYLEVAEEAAGSYYRQFELLGFTSGGCGDILQNADSETAIALATSLITLYEATGNEKYLRECENLAALCATWTVSFDYRLPESTPLGKLGANLTGAVWASTQNKHGAPGFCTQSGDVLFKLYRTTGNRLYADLMRDVIHGHAEGVQLPTGKITERLTYCDAECRGDRLEGGYQGTGWNETNGAMMSYEIPGIYIRTDTGEYYVFDHVRVTDLRRKGDKLQLTLHNPTPYDAEVTVMAEDGAAADRPLGDNAFLGWNVKLRIKAGATRRFTIG